MFQKAYVSTAVNNKMNKKQMARFSVTKCVAHFMRRSAINQITVVVFQSAHLAQGSFKLEIKVV